ncbi:MAG: complex I subunit 5 family protein [Chloroflexota bacterium]
MQTIKTVESLLPILVFIVPSAFSLIIFALGPRHRVFREATAGIGLLAALVVAMLITQRVLAGEVLSAWDQNFYVDGLSAIMELIGSLMGLVVILYSWKYMTHSMKSVAERYGLTSSDEGSITSNRRLANYYGLILLFVGMMNWTCATNNIVMLYVSLEATTLATAFLVTFYWRKASAEAGYKYLLLVTVGITFALFGCVLIYSASLPFLPAGSALLLTEIGKVATKLPVNVVLLAAAFFVAGFGTKAGLVPFHAWLPDAHAEAPVPVSAVLSGIVIKVGAYALARTIVVFAPHYDVIVSFVAIMASLSMVVGVAMALVQDDIKRLLAYSSISQIAYVVEGLGIGTYIGIYGGLFHLVNHTITKGLLFLCVGALVYAAGTRRISELGTVAKKMPLTTFCFFVGALAISGMPPLNGFMSKFTIFLALTESGLLWAAVISIFTGVLTVGLFVWTAYRIFWTKPVPVGNPTLVQAKEVPAPMLVSMVGLALLALLLGVYPQILYPLLDSATNCVLNLLAPQ